MPVTMPTGGDIAREQWFAELYATNRPRLLGLAGLLVDEPAAREDIVQEAYLRVHLALPRLRDPDKTLTVLDRTVVNLARSTLRRRQVAQRYAPKLLSHGISADLSTEAVDRVDLVRAIAALSGRQRQAVALRYCHDLSEQQTAAAMGVSVGSVKNYCSLGLARLRKTLVA